MKAKHWLIGFFAVVLGLMAIIGGTIYYIDPYMHFHYPHTDKFYYELNNERSQNYGIVKQFDYDALITGSSMTQNFKASEMDKIFGTNSIKATFAGSPYKETGDLIRFALEYNDKLRTVVCSMDGAMLMWHKDTVRSDLGKHPDYLYDDNPFNDVKYLCNKDVLFNVIFPMLRPDDANAPVSGITSFDAYGSWYQDGIHFFGINTILPNGVPSAPSEEKEVLHLSDTERETIRESIAQNITSNAAAHPEVTFYYFIPPYSADYWREQLYAGTLVRQIEAEQYAIEMLLEHDNIKLFSFYNCTDITTDLNNYMDSCHYGEWVNSLILEWMHEGKYQLTKENYLDYLAEEREFYTSFDYSTLADQPDYEADRYAAALLNVKEHSLTPRNLLESPSRVELSSASYSSNDAEPEITCAGYIPSNFGPISTLPDYFLTQDYVGAKITAENDCGYKYLVFSARCNSDFGQLTVFAYNNKGEVVAELKEAFETMDEDYHMYTLDISAIEGDMTIILNGGFLMGEADTSFSFKDIYLY